MIITKLVNVCQFISIFNFYNITFTNHYDWLTGSKSVFRIPNSNTSIITILTICLLSTGLSIFIKFKIEDGINLFRI